jgi:hypothetical protein
MVTMLWIIDCLFACVGTRMVTTHPPIALHTQKGKSLRERGAQPANALEISPGNASGCDRRPPLWGFETLLWPINVEDSEDFNAFATDFLLREPRYRPVSVSTTIAQVSVAAMEYKTSP